MWVEPLRVASVEVVPERAEREQKVAVLLNAHARRVTQKVVRALSHVVPEGDLFLSRSELDARRIAQAVVERGYDTVFSGGGDGTFTCFVNEIATQVAQRRRHVHTAMPRFGILKLGTGNSMASVVRASPTRGDGIVDDVLRARAGEVPGVRSVDMLLIDGKRAPFAGLGVDGRLLNDYVWLKQTLAQGPFSRLFTGPTGYFTSIAFKTVPHYLVRRDAVSCEVVNGAGPAYRMGPDGKPVGAALGAGEVLYRGPLMMAAAGTVPFYGFDFKMFPFAGTRRGMMQLRLGCVPAAQVLANLPRMWKGTWLPEGLHDFLVRDAHIRFSEPMPLQVGGDAEGYRDEVRIQVAPEPIELLDFTGALH